MLKCMSDYSFIIEGNTRNPDQTAPFAAVGSGSVLFARTYVDERADDKNCDLQGKRLRALSDIDDAF